ncbi:MAG: hypothetical protein FJ303_14190 [Planctomycetes bacterium]|nr:hypothetical protein [Planctomycetota bacterium]
MLFLKPVLAGLTLFLIAAQAHAEYRTVLIQIKHGKDRRLSVSIYSDEKKEQRSAISVDEAVKLLKAMQGWGSSVGVYVTSDGRIPSPELKKLLVAITDNAWLDLVYYGNEVPRVVGDHFLKAAPAK